MEDDTRLSPSDRRAVARFDPRPSRFRRMLCETIAILSRGVMRGLNHLENPCEESLATALSRGRGLITFSNHVSFFDDPFLTACLGRPRWEKLRWVGADAHNFFGSWLKGVIFNAGKCVPIVRGAGIDQPGMRFLQERLTAGEWVHLFPEGGRTRDPDGLLRLPFKSGLARMVRASRPLLLPFLHHGMREVLPIGAWLPRAGRRVVLKWGSLEDSSAGLADESEDAITRWAETTLAGMQGQLLAELADRKGSC